MFHHQDLSSALKLSPNHQSHQPLNLTHVTNGSGFLPKSPAKPIKSELGSPNGEERTSGSNVNRVSAVGNNQHLQHPHGLRVSGVESPGVASLEHDETPGVSDDQTEFDDLNGEQSRIWTFEEQFRQVC